jgi:Spy/CpxP family protein refolding chaperone
MNPEVRRKASEWLALVFFLGVAVGGLFGYSFAHRSYAASRLSAPTLSEPERRAKRIAEMTKDIGLTPEQTRQFDSIIHAAHDEMKGIHEKSDADIDAVRQKAREQMRAVLTPEQKPTFEEYVQKLDEERKKAGPKQ